MLHRKMVLFVWVVAALSCPVTRADDSKPVAGANARRPADDAELRFWLTNMLVDHRFTLEETALATGLSSQEILSAVDRLKIDRNREPQRASGDSLRVLPYPGGRHPRSGFLEGAIDPQRETKISVFAPWNAWNDGGYVVADIPEAIWSNLGLTYLAHTHVPTIWSKQGITLAPQEWSRKADGSLASVRKLPGGIEFGTKVTPQPTQVRMEMWLTNGTKETLSDLRVQNCVMLKELPGFTAQTNDNKVFQKPYVACRSEDGRRWVITAWEPCQRVWGNAPCPCLHSDPQFPDCRPGETKRLRGWLSFYEGTDLDAELQRIDAIGWRNAPRNESR